MSRPETITLSAAAGEAIIERLSVYAPSRSDCERLIQVLRWYFSHSIDFSGNALRPVRLS